MFQLSQRARAQQNRATADRWPLIAARLHRAPNERQESARPVQPSGQGVKSLKNSMKRVRTLVRLTFGREVTPRLWRQIQLQLLSSTAVFAAKSLNVSDHVHMNILAAVLALRNLNQ